MDILLRAFAELERSSAMRLWIAGDGPQKPDLENLARRLNISDRVTFLGWLDHSGIADHMAKAHLFVLASCTDPETGESEGSPTVLLEAQARGLPVVSTLHADIPYIVKDGQTGILVPEADSKALSKAIDHCLRDPGRWKTLSPSARAFVKDRHDMYRVGTRLEQIYEQCL